MIQSLSYPGADNSYTLKEREITFFLGPQGFLPSRSCQVFVKIAFLGKTSTVVCMKQLKGVSCTNIYKYFHMMRYFRGLLKVQVSLQAEFRSQYISCNT